MLRLKDDGAVGQLIFSAPSALLENIPVIGTDRAGFRQSLLIRIVPD